MLNFKKTHKRRVKTMTNQRAHSSLLLLVPLALTSMFLTHSAYAGNAYGQNMRQQASANTNRIIIKYKDSSTLNTLSSLSTISAANNAANRNGMRLSHVRRMQSGAHVMKLSKHRKLTEINNLLSELNTDPEVEYAEADLLLQPLATPNDSRYNEQWQYFEANGGMNLPLAWDVTQGLGAVVAVIDTGYRSHSDLNANILPGYDMISDTSISQDGNGRDADASDAGDWAPAGACGTGSPATNSSWHGTHVAGSIAAVGNNGIGVTGAAYKAKVVPVRVLGRCGGYTSDIADGIIWAAGGTVTGAPANVNPADVINLSLGGGGACGVTQQNAINTARNLGATVVVAAGNENTNAANSNPANCSGVITVAAINRNGGRAYYSNYGAVVDVAAPGGDTSTGAANGILSTLNNGSTTPSSESYAFYQGTSMATPHVAGVAALLYAVKPAITADEVEQVLKSSSRVFPATCSQCGSGIVDASAAVNAVNTGTPPTSSNQLVNGISKIGLAAVTAGELRYTIDVPAGASDLQFKLSGGTGDADLYVKFNSAPTTTSYDCRPYLNGNNETCNITPTNAGTYHVLLKAYSSFSNATITASYTEASSVTTGSINETNLSGVRGQWQHFTLQVARGEAALNVNMNGGSGDADLYVRFAATPTTASYNCRPYRNGNIENCNISNPQAGIWHVSIRAYSTYSGVNLTAGN